MFKSDFDSEEESKPDLLQIIKQMMDAYGNYEHQRQFLNAERKKLKDSLLSPEIQADLESIDLEFDQKEKLISENEKKVRKQLDSVINDYKKHVENTGQGETKIHSQLMNLTISDEVEVYWDTEGLDKLIKEGRTELLEFRKTKPLRTRLTKRGL